jgi:hypothetical protein
VKVEHMALPPDLVNGVVFSVAKNLLPDAAEMKVSMIVAMPKPRLVKVAISSGGDERFSVAGAARNAWRLDMKIELGGIAGKVAPLIGKQPPDIRIWILEGPAPAFVKEQGILFADGPVLTIELTSPVWPRGSS